MEAIEFWKYFNCIDSLRSKEQLSLFEANSFPHLKQNKRTELFNKVSRNINKIIELPKKQLADYSETMKTLKGFFSG